MKIGIDLGGTHIGAGLVNDKGDIIMRETVATSTDHEYTVVLDQIKTLIQKIQVQARNQYTITQVGIGIPGILTRDNTLILECPNLGWKKVALKKDLETLITLPVYMGNDASVAGIAENVYGSTKGYHNAVFMTIGTGVGGSIIINDQIITGVHGVASELGHMIITENYYDCNCGKNGCLETFSSATAIIKLAQQRISEGAKSTILKRASSQLKAINAKHVLDAAIEDQDPVGLECLESLATHLGIAIANLNDILDPEIFSIGGGVSQAGEKLLDVITQAVALRLTYPDIAVPKIVLAKLGNDAGIIGAAYLEQYF